MKKSVLSMLAVAALVFGRLPATEPRKQAKKPKRLKKLLL